MDGLELMTGLAAIRVCGHSVLNPTRIGRYFKLRLLSKWLPRNRARDSRHSLPMIRSPAGTLGKK